jgi:tRNA 2-thiouridine synthesizing protein A
MKHRWDAGDMGCGRLVFELRRRILDIEPGATLEVVAQSDGAPADLPAWCRMTGHVLLSAEPPVYVIRRKGAQQE